MYLPPELWGLVLQQLSYPPAASNRRCLRDVRRISCVSHSWRTLCAAGAPMCCMQVEAGGPAFCTTHEGRAIELWRCIWHQHARWVASPRPIFAVPSHMFVHPLESARTDAATLTAEVLQNAALLRCVEARAANALPLRFLDYCCSGTGLKIEMLGRAHRAHM